MAVIERSTGRVFAGVAAPTQEEIVEWLQDHPTFEVLRPSGLFHFVLYYGQCKVFIMLLSLSSANRKEGYSS